VGIASDTYKRLEIVREPFLARAREFAQLTIPHLVRQNSETDNSAAELTQTFQSMGARGVNNLASKLLLTLMPPNALFFRFILQEAAMAGLRPKQKNAIDDALALNERATMQEINLQNSRVFVFDALRQALVAGNALIHLPDEGPRVFHLDSYVVDRDPRGNVVTIVTQTRRSPLTLPKELQGLVDKGDIKSEASGQGGYVEIHTMVQRKGAGFEEFRELAGKVIPGSQRDWRVDEMPYIPLRMQRMDGEDYGRAYVEEYVGDLRSLEGLSKAILEAGVAGAKIIFLVDPSGLTDLETLDGARNGDIRPGRAQDVQTVQSQKFADLRTAELQVQRIENRLSDAFLLNNPRQAERVTAEEIRVLAQELEDALGGSFSQLATELQDPLVSITVRRLERQGRINPQPEEVKTAIVTGLAAIGRGHELLRLDTFIGGALQLFGSAVLEHLNVSEYLRRRAVASGIEDEGLVKAEEQLAQERQAQQMAALAARVGPEFVKQAGPELAAAANSFSNGAQRG
jgi:hypothetical protein